MLKLTIIRQYQEAHSTSSSTEAERQRTSEIVNDLYNLILSINRRHWESRALSALPETVEQAIQAAMSPDGLRVNIQPQHVRSPEWLAAHGACMDNIRPGVSTLQQAGHGAFAARPLTVHQVITISPLHHLPDFTWMNMYKLQRDNSQRDDVERWFRLKDEVVRMQLLYNYCFGVYDSTILLCPYGAGVNYINHNQSLANVRIEWVATDEFTVIHNQTLVEKGTVDDLSSSSKPQLAFRYVATRDISTDEELFLDYGDDWEEAWWEHTRQYPRTANNVSHRYVSARYYNERLGDVAVRTEEEQAADAYPDNLQIRCHRGVSPSEVHPDAEYVWRVFEYGYPCQVWDRFKDDGRDLYSVTLQLDDGIDRMLTWLNRTDVPRSAIRFFDRPYTSDIHHETSFRHEIAVPDSVFPEQWRNMN